MKDLLYLVWRYVAFHRWKTAILALSITLIIYLPVGLNVLVDQSAEQLTARAHATPLLVGAKGSPLELVLSSLYFDADTPALSRFGDVRRVRETGLAEPVPLYVRYAVRNQPVVGTTLEYFEFRELQIAEGRVMGLLGEAVLGAMAARELDVRAGDSIVSSPENVFDLAGVYPLKMRVVGVLAPAFSADDDAVFVDLKTSWIMEGLGHGHQNLASAEAAAAVLKRDGNRIVANAAVVQYNEITDDNIDSFHFHGDHGGFPITAVLAVPRDQKSAVILQGRFEGAEDASQIVRPVDVVEELLGTVLTIRQFVVAAVVIVGTATLATAILVFMLSLRLRRRERVTLFKIGGSRQAVAGLLMAEIAAVAVVSGALAAVLTLLTRYYGADLIRALFL
ncbi:MAG: ABC transporter permease [Gammaproteobacteria bacterium]